MHKKNILSLLFLSAFCVAQLSSVPLTAAAETAPECGKLVTGTCLACHHETRICRKVGQNKGKRAWIRTLKSMTRHGAAVNNDNQEQLLSCLSTPDEEITSLCK